MDNKPLDNKLLLLNSIILLYRESQLPGSTERSINLVRSVLGLIKLPENIQLTLDPTSQILDGLKRLALTMSDDPQGHQYEEIELLQQIKLLCGEDAAFYESFEKGITAELKETSLKRTCLNMRRSLTNHLRNENVKSIIHKANVQLVFKPDGITDMKKFVGEVVAELEPYQQDALEKDPAIVSHIDFNNFESIKTVYEDVQKEADGSSILITPWQGIKRMFRGGIRRGEQIVVGALQHNYKTGFTLNMFKGFAIYNKPEMIDRNKTPLLLRFSFEDDINLNMRFLYTSLKENETRQKVTDEELQSLPAEEIARYVHDKMRVNGYHIDMLRVDPTQWGYRDLCNKILEYEAEGFEVHACVTDYLYMLPTVGCTQGPAGHDVRDLFRRTRNFFNPRKISFITPHQLSTDAKQLVRDGREDFVKEIAGKGYYAGSKQIDQEVDAEIYIHIEKRNGKSFLTCQRGKHRIVGQTPILDQYCVLPFDPDLGILDDVLGEDTSLRRPGGGRVGSGEETPFWETDKQAAGTEIFG